MKIRRVEKSQGEKPHRFQLVSFEWLMPGRAKVKLRLTAVASGDLQVSDEATALYDFLFNVLRNTTFDVYFHFHRGIPARDSKLNYLLRDKFRYNRNL